MPTPPSAEKRRLPWQHRSIVPVDHLTIGEVLRPEQRLAIDCCSPHHQSWNCESSPSPWRRITVSSRSTIKGPTAAKENVQTVTSQRLLSSHSPKPGMLGKAREIRADESDHRVMKPQEGLVEVLPRRPRGLSCERRSCFDFPAHSAEQDLLSGARQAVVG